MSPEIAASLGISISFQHPAILDDLSVLENLQVALPASVFAGKAAQIAAKEMLDAVGLHVPLRTRADALTVAQKHLLEIAKALAIKPKVLMLDEPTASLDQDSTEMLFERIRGVVKTGTSVIYITHRLAELRQIAHRVTVLRDGRVRGGGLVDEIGDADLLSMIVGRTLGSAFPPKSDDGSKEVIFSVKSLSGRGFHDVSFEVARGQIVGVAGVEGNGQSELMRALAGLQPSEGVDQSSRTLAEDQGASARGGLHPFGQAYGRLGRRPHRARKRIICCARQVFHVRDHEQEEGAGPSRRDVQLPRRQDAEHRSANPFALRRQPAKGCHVACPAIRAGPYRCRRAHAGRRCRRAL